MRQFIDGCGLTEVGVVYDGAGLFDVAFLNVDDGAGVLAVQDVTDGKVVRPIFVLQTTIKREKDGQIKHASKERKKERMVALCPHTLKRIRGGWSHYTDTSEPVDGYWAQNMVTVQSGFQTSDLSITGPTR
jgi:hypothetical protein